MSGERRLRLGMVGGGQGAFIGEVHRIAARLDDQYELVSGALSSDPERARASGQALRLSAERSYTTYQAMAQAEAQRKDGIDAVSIVTPNHLHFDVAKTFLQSGIHVICDKPLTTEVGHAKELAALVRKTSRVFVVTYNYSGYPMVRQAREMVRAGDIGGIRVIQVEYPQGWLMDKLEDTGLKQAQWRTDPARSGPGGCLGDIGTHAYHLAGFVSGLSAVQLAADLNTFVAGRRLDDNVHILLRYENGAKGMLWASQVACGHENGLRLRIYGSKGSLRWEQENPNYLDLARHGEPAQRITRGGAGAGEAAQRATRIPGGHPEGYLEAFAQLYKEAAQLIRQTNEGASMDKEASILPTVEDGARGVRFIEAALESHRSDGRWVSTGL